MAVTSRKLRRAGSKASLSRASQAANSNLALAVKYHAVYDAVAGAINPEFLTAVETLLAGSMKDVPGVTHAQLFDLTRKAAITVLRTDVPPFAADTPMDGSYGDSANLPLANSDLPVSEDPVSGGAADSQPTNDSGEGK